MSANPIAMPKLGMTMEEGSVISWEVAVGDAIAKGEPLLVIETEKTEAEIEATASGTLRHVWVSADGEPVPCGTLLGVLTDSPDEELDLEAFHAEHDQPEARAPATAPATAPAAPAASSGPAPPRKPVAPAARARAKQLGIDPADVPGTGPGGRVTRQDVDAHAAARENLVPVDDGVSLEVLRSGQGETLLLLPGFGTDVSAFAPQIGTLAEHFAVVGVNPRGVGHSDAPEVDAHPVERAALDAAAATEGPLHVVGASLGAAVALELALAAPERVRSLTLVTPFIAATPRLLAVTEAWIAVARAGDAELLARTLLPWLFSPGFLGDDKARERTVRGLAVTLARVSAATLERQAAGLRAWSGTRDGDIGRITVPTRVVLGGGDLLTPGGDALAAAIPGAVCDVVPEAGHALAIEGSEAVTRSILESVGA